MPEARETFKLKGAKFVRFYPADWRSGCFGMSLEQEGLYVRICAFVYETNRRLPLDDSTAAKFMGLHTNAYRKVRDQLAGIGKIERETDGWTVRRVEKELVAAIGHSPSSDQERGVVGQADQNTQGDTHQDTLGVTPPDTPPDTHGVTRGVFSENGNEINGPSIEPIANSQKPVKNPQTPKGASDDMPSHVKPVLSWNTHFAPVDDPSSHAGVVRNEAGSIALVNGTYLRWLEKFGNDAERLELALVTVSGEINITSRKPLAADVESRLARLLADKLDRDKRYASAAAGKTPQTFNANVKAMLEEMGVK